MPFLRALAATLLCLLLGDLPVAAQRFIYNPPGIDTALRVSLVCDTLRSIQHWQARAKYPVGSEVLAGRANAWLQNAHAVDTAVNGLIGFRFHVDCEGRPSNFLCEQSCLRWEPIRFPDAVVLALHRFVLSLAPMPIGYAGTQRQKVSNYYTYFSFFIRNGKIQSVAP